MGPTRSYIEMKCRENVLTQVIKSLIKRPILTCLRWLVLHVANELEHNTEGLQGLFIITKKFRKFQLECTLLACKNNFQN